MATLLRPEDTGRNTAADLIATQLALGLAAYARPDRESRLWEPRRLRLRLFSPAAKLVTARQRHLWFAGQCPRPT